MIIYINNRMPKKLKEQKKKKLARKSAEYNEWLNNINNINIKDIINKIINYIICIYQNISAKNHL